MCTWGLLENNILPSLRGVRAYWRFGIIQPLFYLTSKKVSGTVKYDKDPDVILILRKVNSIKYV